MKKTKTKKTTRSRKPKQAKYPVHFLAIALIGFLLLEGALIGSSTGTDWQNGMTVLDISSGVGETFMDTTATIQPAIEQVTSIYEFYMRATTEMIVLLDMSRSFSDVALIYNGVNEFYLHASVEMANLLDISQVSDWPARVAGVSVENY